MRNKNGRKSLEEIIMTAGDLPTIPVVATRVIQLIENEGTTAEELEKVISSDPAVTARVLKISNSSFYGAQRQIQTLPHAIMMLGFVTLKSVVVTASVKQVYHPYGLTEKLLWDHSFGAGLAARLIAQMLHFVNPDEAFLGGLFHDIGKQVMNHLDKRRFSEAMQYCYNEGVSFFQTEKQIFGYRHAEAGALVIRKWNFPEHLNKVVEQHHTLDLKKEDDPYLFTLACVVNLANQFCHRFGIGTISADDALDLSAARSAVLLELSKDQIRSLCDSFLELHEKDQALFS